MTDLTSSTAFISLVYRLGLIIKQHHINQPNKSKLALYNPLLHFYSQLKQLYISNKMECFNYKGGCGICGCTHIKMSKKRACLYYR